MRDFAQRGMRFSSFLIGSTHGRNSFGSTLFTQCTIFGNSEALERTHNFNRILFFVVALKDGYRQEHDED